MSTATTETRLSEISDIKDALRTSIQNKGVLVESSNSMMSYSDKISTLFRDDVPTDNLWWSVSPQHDFVFTDLFTDFTTWISSLNPIYTENSWLFLFKGDKVDFRIQRAEGFNYQYQLGTIDYWNDAGTNTEGFNYNVKTSGSSTVNSVDTATTDLHVEWAPGVNGVGGSVGDFGFRWIRINLNVSRVSEMVDDITPTITPTITGNSVLCVDAVKNYLVWDNSTRIHCPSGNFVYKSDLTNAFANSKLKYVAGFGSGISLGTNMFQNCTELQEVVGLDTSAVTNMDYAFDGCTKLIAPPELDLSNCVSAVGMLQGCTSSYSENYSQSFPKVVNLERFLSLSSAKSVTLNIPKCTNLGSSLRDSLIDSAVFLNSSLVSKFDACFLGSSVTKVEASFESSASLYYCFFRCDKLITLPRVLGGKFCTNFVQAISYCPSLELIDSTIISDKGTNFDGMINVNPRLTRVESVFDTSQGKTFPTMFAGDFQLEFIPALNVSNSNISSSTVYSSMFRDCASLTTLGETLATTDTSLADPWGFRYSVSFGDSPICTNSILMVASNVINSNDSVNQILEISQSTYSELNTDNRYDEFLASLVAKSWSVNVKS